MNRADLKKRRGLGAAVLAALVVTVGGVVWRSHVSTTAPAAGTPWVWTLPKGFPQPFVPADNLQVDAGGDILDL